MTSKDITAEGSPLGNNVAGRADCIGGVRYADRAFAVGDVFAAQLYATPWATAGRSRPPRSGC